MSTDMPSCPSSLRSSAASSWVVMDSVVADPIAHLPVDDFHYDRRYEPPLTGRRSRAVVALTGRGQGDEAARAGRGRSSGNTGEGGAVVDNLLLGGPRMGKFGGHAQSLEGGFGSPALLRHRRALGHRLAERRQAEPFELSANLLHEPLVGYARITVNDPRPAHGFRADPAPGRALVGTDISNVSSRCRGLLRCPSPAQAYLGW